ncbi:MAG: hypothetical protein N838_35945 [Thiohalocapsa sp. PB-PSB1]|nr:MAG: hypothetical protein N838_35945 [Thiohalocapsa sp. PB-PSB1]
MGKETLFDGIVLRTVGRIMSSANFDPKLIGEALQVLFKEVVTGTVTPPPSHSTRMEVALGQCRLGLPRI